MRSLAALKTDSQTRVEAWRYTDLDAMAKRYWDAANKVSEVETKKPSPAAGRIVFVDGVLDNVASDFGALPQNCLQQVAASHYKLKVEGATCLITQPIELVYIKKNGGQEQALVLEIEVGKSARLTLLERFVAPANAIPDCVETHIKLHDQAKLVHGRVFAGCNSHAAVIRADVHAGAFYDCVTLSATTQFCRQEIDIRLLAPMAQCNLNGIILAQEQSHIDTLTTMRHEAAGCSSHQYFKIIAGDKGQGIYQGKIIVAPDAQKTDAQQMCRGLLLSDQAEIDTRPELEIEADDVRCSHGCSVGALDEEAIFYLRARGIDEMGARKLLTHAFVAERVTAIPVPEWQGIFETLIEEALHGHP